MTGDQIHTGHITTGQRVSRHSCRPEFFYFSPHRTFLKTILASRTSGTFDFAPIHKPTLRKTKRATFTQRTDDNYKLDTNNMLKNMFNILHLLKLNILSLTH